MHVKFSVKFTILSVFILSIFIIKPLSVDAIHYERFTDLHKAKRWGDAAHVKWKQGLKQEGMNAIIEYTKNANPINSYLRENDGCLGTNLAKDQKIKQIDKALTQTNINHHIVVYRGTDGIIFGERFQQSLMNGHRVNREIAAEIKETYIGTLLTERGYLSTSLVNETQFMYRPVLIELKVPSGTSAAYIDPISYYPGQYELLFARNTRYYIDDIKIIVDKGMQRLKVEARIIN